MDRPSAVAVAERVAALEALFDRIEATRMQGIPILHPGLRVQACGFEALPGVQACVGVLVTPWFMNLVWLPLDAEAADTAAPGATRDRDVGNETFPFIGAHESGFGRYEVCSLFSPMGDFADHDSAMATAQAVLAELRKPVAPPPANPERSRRALLLGRGRGAGARA